ncbi:MAG: sulfotransferase [Synechococcaceae cyanobacterium]|nr:sulfotransferase [Synechococcaceae cyanobacterium]
MQPAAELPKVVAIGFNKCATRSLAQLFAAAGHTAVHQKLPRRWLSRRRRKLGGIMRANLEAGRPVFAGVEHAVFYGDLIDSNQHATFDGNSLFREILRDYPTAILLLNWRDQDDWIRSRLQHGHGEFALREQRLRRLGSPEELCAIWRAEWDAHLAAVRSFMADRPEQFVQFNIDTDPIETLIARLPAYGLRPEHFGDIGRSRGRRRPIWLQAAQRWLAHHRPRAQR